MNRRHFLATAAAAAISLRAEGRRYMRTRTLFLHGFPISSFQWRGAIELLASDRRCLAPDFLGLGNTDVASGQAVDPEAQCDMLAAFLRALSVNSVDLIASDSGGAVAPLFLARHPRKVRTLLLTNCDTEIDNPRAMAGRQDSRPFRQGHRRLMPMRIRRIQQTKRCKPTSLRSSVGPGRRTWFMPTRLLCSAMR